MTAENEKLRRQNQRLAEERRKAEIIIDVQKISLLLGRPLPPISGSGTADGRGGKIQFPRGVKRACQHLSIARSGMYRRRNRRLSPPPGKTRQSFMRRLKDEEKSAVLACLHEERFQGCSPAQVYASLLDDGQYHCSVRTMYRLLEAAGENREHRDQLLHPPYLSVPVAKRALSLI